MGVLESSVVVICSPSLSGDIQSHLAYQVLHLPNQQLKKTVDDLQAKLALAKGEYKAALKSLERISDEIHERRRSNAMGPRGCGVGAEGSSISVEKLSGSRPEPDAISGESGQLGPHSICNLLSGPSCPTGPVFCPSLKNWRVGQPCRLSGNFS